MDKPIVIYDEARGKILAKYVENFGKVCEVDVTDQALQAVFRYLMAHGLSLNEHRTPTFEPVRHGRWVYTGEWNLPECSVCRKVAHSALYGDEDAYCPCCGAKMDGGKE